MAPYRTTASSAVIRSPAAPEVDHGSGLGDGVVYWLLLLIGGGRVAQALILSEVWHSEATIALLMFVFGAWGLLCNRPDPDRRPFKSRWGGQPARSAPPAHLPGERRVSRLTSGPPESATTRRDTRRKECVSESGTGRSGASARRRRSGTDHVTGIPVASAVVRRGTHRSKGRASS
jgi:hypothetical protein